VRIITQQTDSYGSFSRKEYKEWETKQIKLPAHHQRTPKLNTSGLESVESYWINRLHEIKV